MWVECAEWAYSNTLTARQQNIIWTSSKILVNNSHSAKNEKKKKRYSARILNSIWIFIDHQIFSAI